jgi:hypothetical protein
MIYFKTVYLNSPDKTEVEKAIRKLASKRDSSIDLVSSGSLAGTDRLFIGSEGKYQVNFTRIRYYIEGLLPKIIISFPKSEADNYYKLRLSFRTTLVFCLFTILFIMGCIAAISGENGFDAFFIFTIVALIFFLLILLEIKLTKRAIAKAIVKSNLITI